MSATPATDHPRTEAGALNRGLAWACLIAGIPLLVWVLIAGVIAVPPPSFMALYSGPALAAILFGIGTLMQSSKLVIISGMVLVLGIVAWALLP